MKLTVDLPQQVAVDDWHLQAQLVWVRDSVNIQSSCWCWLPFWLWEFIHWRCCISFKCEVNHVDAMLQNVYALTTWRALPRVQGCSVCWLSKWSTSLLAPWPFDRSFYIWVEVQCWHEEASILGALQSLHPSFRNNPYIPRGRKWASRMDQSELERLVVVFDGSWHSHIHWQRVGPYLNVVSCLASLPSPSYERLSTPPYVLQLEARLSA